MVDVSTIDFPTVLTAIMALIISVGGVVVLTGRSKAVAAVSGIVKILGSVADLLVSITDAQADGTFTKEELAVISGKAQAIEVQIADLRADLGV
jgi:glycine cleavage system regulatory protein